MRAFAEQIRPYVPGSYTVLGTDGFGRSDWRRSLRDFFEVDRRHVALAALTTLAEEGEVAADTPRKAIERYEIDIDRPAPWKV
jgi:pyruvate dehydrogenase E1 component